MFAVELRLVAVAMVNQGFSHRKVCTVVGCKRPTLAVWLRNFRSHGSVWNDEARQNAHADGVQFNEELLMAILLLVEQDPQAFLHNHAAVLKALHEYEGGMFAHLHCSTTTLSEFLRRLGFTNKVAERLYQERNDDVRRQHCLLRRLIPRRCVVSIDETHTDGGDVFLKRGWARRDERYRILETDPRAVPRTSTMMAITGDGGILALQTCLLGPAVTSYDWRIFLGTVIENLNPFLEGAAWEDQPANCVLLFDNAGIHDAAGDAFLQANGVHYLRLPPYSPDLQPIEGVFNDLKCYVRSLVHHDRRFLRHPMLLQALAAGMITQRQVVGQFEHVEKTVDSLLA